MLRRREGAPDENLVWQSRADRIGRRPVACDCGGRTPAHTQARARGHADAPRNPSAHRAPADPASIFREGLATMAGRAGPSDPTWGAGHCVAGGLRPELISPDQDCWLRRDARPPGRLRSQQATCPGPLPPQKPGPMASRPDASWRWPIRHRALPTPCSTSSIVSRPGSTDSELTERHWLSRQRAGFPPRSDSSRLSFGR